MSHYYSWQHIQDVADRVDADGMNPRQYATLKVIIDTVSAPKREYLYNRLKNAGYSCGTLEYLFGDFTPADYGGFSGTRNRYKIKICSYRGECFTDSTVCGSWDTEECGVNK